MLSQLPVEELRVKKIIREKTTINIACNGIIKRVNQSTFGISINTLLICGKLGATTAPAIMVIIVANSKVNFSIPILRFCIFNLFKSINL